ncbi:MAG: hypothetical protein U0V73_00590 [Acidimicrobiia bacterium]
MEKLSYLLWLPDAMGPSDARVAVVDGIGGALLALDPIAVTVDVDDEAAQIPPPAPPPPGEPAPRALVSLWLDCYDRRAPYEEVLRSGSDRIAGYLVTESLYREYGGNRWSGRRDWPDGARSPGPLTVTCFEQKTGMSRDDWIEFWHTKQSPMSEAIQPRTRYVRNTVTQVLTPDAPPYAAIVEEAWPSAEHVTDPMLFYCGDGSIETMNANIATMIEHVTTFIDLDTMRNLTMSEWILRSLPT